MEHFDIHITKCNDTTMVVVVDGASVHASTKFC